MTTPPQTDVIDWKEAMQQCGDDEEFLKEVLADLRTEVEAQLSIIAEIIAVSWLCFAINQRDRDGARKIGIPIILIDYILPDVSDLTLSQTLLYKNKLILCIFFFFNTYTESTGDTVPSNNA
jgi:hypothetical protein